MRRPIAVLLLTLALLATGIAVAAEWNLSIALPAAGVAVAAAGLLFGEAWRQRGRSAPAYGPPSSLVATVALRRAFTSGRLGRQAIVDTLDRLERSGRNPELPVRSTDETGQILRMPERQFRDYLRMRLDRLELDS